MKTKSLAMCCLLAVLVAGLSSPGWSDEAGEDWERVVFQLDEARNARWALMLARSYMDDSPMAKLVVVAYGPGIDFLLNEAEDKRGNRYDDRVQALMERGVAFRVCATTLDSRGIARDALLEGVTVVPSGISEIARLQLKEGYAYLKP